MLDAVNKLAKAMRRTVIKRGSLYYICNETGLIRLSEHRNLKKVVSHLAGTLECCDVYYATEEGPEDEDDWRDADAPRCPECGQDWGGTL